MRRWLLLLCLCSVTHRVRADDMDLALSRLRIPAGSPGCAQTQGLCPDNEAFERLVTQLATTAAPPVTTAAHTRGPRGFALAIHHTTTTIDAGNLYWQRGTQGSAADIQQDLNRGPASVLMWTRLELRKGLPLGFEIAADLGHGLGTSMWEVTGRLKVAILEGLRSGAGQLPDLSLEATTQAIAGASDLSMMIQGLHLTLSKPFVVMGRLTLTPLAAAQLLFVSASSQAVDLAAGIADNGCDTSITVCDASLTNVTRFPTLTQWRIRWVAGLQVGGGMVHGLLTAALEAPTASMHDMGRIYGGGHVAGQLAVTAGLGLHF